MPSEGFRLRFKPFMERFTRAQGGSAALQVVRGFAGTTGAGGDGQLRPEGRRVHSPGPAGQGAEDFTLRGLLRGVGAGPLHGDVDPQLIGAGPVVVELPQAADVGEEAASPA